MRLVRDLVLLHGFTQTSATWAPVAAEVAERYRLHAPDLRGHGAASDARPIGFEQVVGDVLGLVDGPCALAGYSMGGRIAQLVALEVPARVERLVLVSSSPGIEDPADRAARLEADEQLAAVVEASPVDEFAERWAAQPLFADQPDPVAALAHEDRLRNTSAGLAAALRGLSTGAMPSLWDRLGELAMPVDLVVGERDAKFRALNEAMAARIPGATLHVISGAGHAVHLERPAEVAAVIAPR